MKICSQWAKGIRIVLLFGFSLMACGETINSENQGSDNNLITENIVDGVVVSNDPFNMEITSNGVLRAVRKSDLHFNTSGVVKRIMVRNGDYVRKGQLIAILNSYSYKQQIEKVEIAYEKALIEKQNLLITHGFDSVNLSEIPQKKRETIENQSGYKEAAMDLEEAKHQLMGTELRAPFHGVVANLEQREYEHTGTKNFCTLIDTTVFEVEFKLIESEISHVGLGDSLLVSPIALGGEYPGIITEINPTVDENGLIELKAEVKNTKALIDGMNVSILIQKPLSNILVVPKKAVLRRQNELVLFKVHDEVLAHWVYVHMLYENSSSYAIAVNKEKIGSLLVGDTVVVSGNLNLAHESKIQLRTVE